MSRKRERFDAITDRSFQSKWRRTDGGQPPSGLDAYVAHMYHTPYRSEIVDESKTRYVQYRKAPVVRRRAFKPVAHFKHSAYLADAAGWYKLDATPYEYYTGGSAIIHAIAKQLTGTYVDTEVLARNWIENKIQALAPADYRHYERWQAVKPTMTTRANLATFLGELTDCKRMWELLPKKHLSLDTWENVRSLFTEANRQHLNFNFGWKPFSRDVFQVLKNVESFEGRFTKFISSVDKELRRRYGDLEQVVDFDEIGQAFTGSVFRYRRKGKIRIKRSSSFDFSYVLPNYGAEELRVRAWLDTLGLRPTMANLYELIPGSFVVDWFWNLGGFLSQYSAEWMQPSVTLHQAMYSSAVNAEWSWSVLMPVAYGSQESPGITSSYSKYTRCLGMPRFSGTTESLDADKIRLGASLLIARLF